MPQDMLIKDMFAEAYGWHPRQVDNLTVEELEWLPRIIQAKTAARTRAQSARTQRGGPSMTGAAAAANRFPR